MSQRTAKPADIKTLQNWVQRWPKVSNLEFDSATREPTLYTTAPRGDPARTKVGTIPWKREADSITVLTQPTKFTPEAVETARKRISALNAASKQSREAGEAQIRVLEGAVLNAWNAYRAAPSMPLLQDVLQAERALTAQEVSLGSNRVVVTHGDYMATYVPPIPLKQRGLPV
jgi:hypothetical protein